MPDSSETELSPYDRQLLIWRREHGPRNPMTKPGDDRLRPKMCGLLAPGHHPHWIQALGSENKPDIAVLTVTGRVVSITRELIVLELPAGKAGFRNHDPWRMRRGGDQVRFNPHYRVLRWPTVPGPAFELAPDEGELLSRCLTDADLADPDRRIDWHSQSSQ
jgi:hypothetical protein